MARNTQYIEASIIKPRIKYRILCFQVEIENAYIRITMVGMVFELECLRQITTKPRLAQRVQTMDKLFGRRGNNVDERGRDHIIIRISHFPYNIFA
jgi:hypothetical protein